jgi:hypothetical protein
MTQVIRTESGELRFEKRPPEERFRGIDKKRLLDLYHNDVSTRMIADELEVSPIRCWRCIKYLNLPTRKIMHKRTYLPIAIYESEFRKMLAKSMTYEEISELLGVRIDICEIIGEMIEFSEKGEKDGNNM